MFERTGVILVDRSELEEDGLLEAALECGAEDLDAIGDAENFRLTTGRDSKRVAECGGEYASGRSS